VLPSKIYRKIRVLFQNHRVVRKWRRKTKLRIMLNKADRISPCVYLTGYAQSYVGKRHEAQFMC